jgi:hypothetical protein
MVTQLSKEGEGLASVLASMRNSAVNSRCTSPVNTHASTGGVMFGKGIVLGETMLVGGAGVSKTAPGPDAAALAPAMPMPPGKKKRSLSLLSEIACPDWQGGGV